MREIFRNIFQLGRFLFARYPGQVGVRPAAFSVISKLDQQTSKADDSELVVFQSVPDKFYFLLFGALRESLYTFIGGRAEVIVVRSISGAIGTGWLATIKRSTIVTAIFSKPWRRAYGKAIDGIAYRSVTLAHPLQDLRDWFVSQAHWEALRLQHEHFMLEIGGVEVGDLIVDAYLRFRPSPRFDVNDQFVRVLIWQSMRDVRQASQYFSNKRPKIYLTSYSTYLEHGVATRVALKYGISVWCFGNLTRVGKRLTQTDPYHTADCSHYRTTFEALDRQSDRLEQARAQLQLRLSGGIDVATSYMRQSAYAGSAAVVPEGLKGGVVIFLHDFYDSPHIYADLVFDDFWEWICFTVETLSKNGASFFLKPHPNQIALSNAALSDLRSKYPLLNWLPAGVTNVQLAEAGIACGVTVYGTVAHELAFLGVPSLCSARHPHHTFDFCRTARTREQYKTFLDKPCDMPLPVEEMKRQALAFYYMHNLYGSAEELEFREIYVNFWRKCNMESAGEHEILQGFDRLRNNAGFARLTKKMMQIEAVDAEPT